MLLPLLPLLPLLIGWLAAPDDSRPDEAEQVEPARLQSAFEALDLDAQHEIVEWYRHEVLQRAGVRQGFVRFLLERGARDADPGTYPVREPAPAYDPEVHAPGQGIERAPLDADDLRVKRARKLLLGTSSRSLEPGYVYDWGSGTILRVADGREVERAFQNALNGFPHDLDLAEALLLAWLDDGAQRQALGAFGHAYADRDGNLYPGITLYDAWSSGESFETPDVDVLGLVHDLEDEWKRWRAPISPSQHPKLYAHVGEDLFAPAHQHRGLREALARCYFVGDAELDDGYGPNLERFHALWEFHGASPEELLEKLPSAKTWKRFLDGWVKKTNRDKKLLAKGQNRRAALAAEAREDYATLVRVMREFGALDP